MINNIYLHDSHVHTTYSHDTNNDGRADLMLCVEKAIEYGIDEISICDHCDIDDILDGIYPEIDFDAVYSSVLEARERYGDKVRINFGIELGQPHVRPDEARELIEKYKFDYVLGTLHNLRLCPDFRFFKFELMKKNHLEYIIRRIIEENMEIVEFGVDCIAHCDYEFEKIIRAGCKIHICDYFDDFAELFKLMIKKNTALEVNCGLLRPLGYTQPCRALCEIYRELGGELVTIGSDCHAAKLIGDGVPETAAMLRELGFKKQCVIRDGKLCQIEL